MDGQNNRQIENDIDLQLERRIESKIIKIKLRIDRWKDNDDRLKDRLTVNNTTQ